MSLTSPTAANPNPADTLTLSDLEKWNRRDAAGNFLPSLAVLGHPVAHSVSPQMHNAALAELAKQHPQLKDWKYFKFDIEPDKLADALKLFHKKEFKGLNLTIPHKVQAVSLLEEVGQDAKEIGAVNTLVATKTGWKGFNTDRPGLFWTLQRDLNIGMAQSMTTTLILGTGGVARSAAVECLNGGNNPNPAFHVWIGGRDFEKVKALCEELRLTNPKRAYRLHAFSMSAVPYDSWQQAGNVLVINGTSAGLNETYQSLFDFSKLLKFANVYVLDMVYRRGGETPFIADARQQGVVNLADGVGMLVWQGAESLCIWLKEKCQIVIYPDGVADTMRTAACQALGLPPRHA